MSDKQAGLTQPRKSSTNKNIRKLRTISMVCSLTSGWQQWAADNEKKQAGEPSGWSPSSLGGPTEEPKKKWVPKKNPPTQSSLTEGSRSDVTSGDAQRSTPHKESPDEPRAAVLHTAKPLIGTAIKVKNVVKTVTTAVQEKSASISLLTEKIKRECMPSEDEIDQILKKKSSPTRRRKCSNMVSSLTKSWKQVENRPGGEGGGEPGGGTSGVGSADDSRECDMVDREETEGDEQASEDESEVKIKRPTVPM